MFGVLLKRDQMTTSTIALGANSSTNALLDQRNSIIIVLLLRFMHVIREPVAPALLRLWLLMPQRSSRYKQETNSSMSRVPTFQRRT